MDRCSKQYVYSCLEDSEVMNSLFRTTHSMRGYAYHVTSIDCCGKTDNTMRIIDWDHNPPRDGFHYLDAEESQTSNEEDSVEDLIDQMGKKVHIKDNKNILKAFEIKKCKYHPSAEGVKAVFLNLTLFNNSLPNSTKVYPHARQIFSEDYCIPSRRLEYPYGHFYQRISIKFQRISKRYPKCKFWCLMKDEDKGRSEKFTNSSCVKQISYICYNEEEEIENITFENKYEEYDVEIVRNRSDEILFYDDIDQYERCKLKIIKDGATKNILNLIQNNYYKNTYYTSIVLLGDIDISEQVKIDVVMKQRIKKRYFKNFV